MIHSPRGSGDARDAIYRRRHCQRTIHVGARKRLNQEHRLACLRTLAETHVDGDARSAAHTPASSYAIQVRVRHVLTWVLHRYAFAASTRLRRGAVRPTTKVDGAAGRHAGSLWHARCTNAPGLATMARVALAKCACQPVATAAKSRRTFSVLNGPRQRIAFTHILRIELRLSQKFGLDFSNVAICATGPLTVARIDVVNLAMLNKNSQRIALSPPTWLRIVHVLRRHFLNFLSSHAVLVWTLCPAAASRVGKSFHVVMFATRYVTLGIALRV